MNIIDKDKLLAVICDVKNQFDVDEIILTPIFNNFEKDCYLLSHIVYFIPVFSSGLSCCNLFLCIHGIMNGAIISVRQTTTRIYCECNKCVFINNCMFFSSVATTTIFAVVYNIYLYWILGITPFIISWMYDIHYTDPQCYLYFHSAWNIIIGFLLLLF